MAVSPAVDAVTGSALAAVLSVTVSQTTADWGRGLRRVSRRPGPVFAKLPHIPLLETDETIVRTPVQESSLLRAVENQMQ